MINICVPLLSPFATKYLNYSGDQHHKINAWKKGLKAAIIIITKIHFTKYEYSNKSSEEASRSIYFKLNYNQIKMNFAVLPPILINILKRFFFKYPNTQLNCYMDMFSMVFFYIFKNMGGRVCIHKKIEHLKFYY